MKFVRVCIFFSKILWSHLFPTVFLRKLFCGKESQIPGSKPARTGLLQKQAHSLTKLGCKSSSFQVGKSSPTATDTIVSHKICKIHILWCAESWVYCFKLHSNQCQTVKVIQPQSWLSPINQLMLVGLNTHSLLQFSHLYLRIPNTQGSC